MEKYCTTYLKAYGKFPVEEFLQDIEIKEDKIIYHEDGNIEIHFGYATSSSTPLEDLYFETIKNLYPRMKQFENWLDKGIKYTLMVDTNIKKYSKEVTVVKFEVSCFVHYTKAYNPDYHIF